MPSGITVYHVKAGKIDEGNFIHLDNKYKCSVQIKILGILNVCNQLFACKTKILLRISLLDFSFVVCSAIEHCMISTKKEEFTCLL
jgi:hypothetical protein